MSLRRPSHRAAPLAVVALLTAGLLGPVPDGLSVARAANAPLPASGFARHLSAQVYGYLPYWELDSGTDASLRYDLLTDIALYAVTLNSDGSINTSTNGYAAVTSSLADTIISHAHAAGVRVDLTVTSFGLAKNTAFFSDTVAQATAVTAIASLVADRGVDGVNVDVENLHNADFPAYAAWVAKIRAAIVAADPAGRVTVATNGASSGALMAADALKAGADRAFLMGYGYRSAGSNPAGSISPVTRSDGGQSLSTSLAAYASAGVPSNRILLGLPYFGMTWPTTTGGAHATTNGAGYTFIPRTGMAGIPAGTSIGYDSLEQSAWFAVQDPTTGSWSETYFDNGQSLRAKYGLVSAQRLAGAGIWALGYERGVTGYWEAIAASFGVTRLAGADRYGTAAAVSAANIGAGPSTVFVATGTAFPDALAGAVAAARASTALLLVQPTSIPSATATELKRLHPSQIVVLGGAGAVSDGVVHDLGTYAPGGVTRIGGADRYATAALVAKATFPAGAPVAYLATGTAFPDALSAAPVAASQGGPVLLTNPTKLPTATATELQRLDPATVVIVGGEGAVSSGVVQAVSTLLPTAHLIRLGGSDRYATSALVAGQFAPGAPAVYVATGVTFPDALSASAVAGASASPLLLTTATTLPSEATSQIERIGPPRAIVLGGTDVVSDSVVNAIRTALATP
jgi:putative cell wall-binding protein/spore germination protein YaaH